MHDIDKKCACACSTAVPGAPRGVARVGGHRKVAIQPELNCSFSLQSCSCTQDSTDTAKGAIALDLRKYFCKA